MRTEVLLFMNKNDIIRANALVENLNKEKSSMFDGKFIATYFIEENLDSISIVCEHNLTQLPHIYPWGGIMENYIFGFLKGYNVAKELYDCQAMA